MPGKIAFVVVLVLSLTAPAVIYSIASNMSDSALVHEKRMMGCYPMNHGNPDGYNHYTAEFRTTKDKAFTIIVPLFAYQDLNVSVEMYNLTVSGQDGKAEVVETEYGSGLQLSGVGNVSVEAWGNGPVPSHRLSMGAPLPANATNYDFEQFQKNPHYMVYSNVTIEAGKEFLSIMGEDVAYNGVDENLTMEHCSFNNSVPLDYKGDLSGTYVDGILPEMSGWYTFQGEHYGGRF